MSATALSIALSLLPFIPGGAPAPGVAADGPESLGGLFSAQDPAGKGSGGDDEEEAPDPELELTLRICREVNKLTGGAYGSYDGKTLRVVYDSPDELQSELEFIGAAAGTNIEFRPQYVRAKGEDGIYCFGGHTGGGALLKPRFVGPVKFKSDIQYQWVDRASHFMTLVHSTPEDFRGADFGIRAIEKPEKKKKIKFHPAELASFNDDPSKWVDRTGPRNQSLEVAEDGSITMKLDADSAKFPGEKGPGRGRVGFLWEGVKFVVQRIEVEGVLDREWAKKALGPPPGP